MLASDVLTDVREELNDQDDSQYRWTNASLFKFLTHAQLELKKFAGHAFLTADNEMAYPASVTSLETPLPVDDTWKRPLTFSVCAQALSADGADGANMERANEYMKQFIQHLIGSPSR